MHNWTCFQMTLFLWYL